MNSIQAASLDKPHAKRPAPLDLARFFFSGAAASLLVFMVIGFHHFYLHGKAYPGRDLTPPIRSLIILHGSAMATWMLFSVIQPILIAAGKRRIHAKLGMIGAIVAACVVFFGWRLGIESTRVNPAHLRIWGLPPKQFMIVPIVSIVIFAGFVIAGVWHRRRPEFHRPMMLLATLSAMPAAVSRIDFINAFYVGTAWETIFGPFFATLIIGMCFVVLHSLLNRSVNKCFVTGYLGLVAASALIIRMATTDVWDSVASFLLR